MQTIPEMRTRQQETGKPAPGRGAGAQAAAVPRSGSVIGSRLASRQAVSLTLTFLLSATAVLWAQDYSLDWFAVAGGGSSSTGGVFAVSGTIGQAEVGVASGGRFILAGGFWSVVGVVQTPGAPLLSVTSSNGVVTVWWPLPELGWRLQATSSLDSPILWTEIPPPYRIIGTSLSFVEAAPAGSKFYRLHRP